MPLCVAAGSPEVAAWMIVRVTTAQAASTTAIVTPDTPRCPPNVLVTDEIAFRDVRTDNLDLYDWFVSGLGVQAESRTNGYLFTTGVAVATTSGWQ
jgi:hypothetical protein